MMFTKRELCLLLILTASMVGCGGNADPASMERLDYVPGYEVAHQWSKIFNFQIQGTARVRQHVGYLDRRFSSEDPDGKTFVYDRKHDLQGFILPSGMAYSYVIRESRVQEPKALGNTGRDNGIRRILQLTGQIELETVNEANTALDK